jgi:hypothetical protein
MPIWWYCLCLWCEKRRLKSPASDGLVFLTKNLWSTFGTSLWDLLSYQSVTCLIAGVIFDSNSRNGDYITSDTWSLWRGHWGPLWWRLREIHWATEVEHVYLVILSLSEYEKRRRKSPLIGGHSLVKIFEPLLRRLCCIYWATDASHVCLVRLSLIAERSSTIKSLSTAAVRVDPHFWALCKIFWAIEVSQVYTLILSLIVEYYPTTISVGISGDALVKTFEPLLWRLRCIYWAADTAHV